MLDISKKISLIAFIMLIVHGCGIINKTPEDFLKAEWTIAKIKIEKGETLKTRGTGMIIKGESMIKEGELKQESVKTRVIHRYGEERAKVLLKEWGGNKETENDS